MPKIKIKLKFRPGWHIEDTAITETLLGQQYDLHGGAIDLIFPHHEAEIAQMEAISGKKPFVKYWLHTGFLQVNKERMGKSKGNFSRAREVLKDYNKTALRFLFSSTHYRKPIEFSDESLETAKNNANKLNEFLLKLNNYKSKSKDNKEISKLIKETKNKFEEEMDNDFETANAITSIFDFTKKINKLISNNEISEKDSKKIKEFMQEIDSIFGILEEEIDVPKEIKELAEEREKARKNKNFKLADQLREEIKSKGYYIDDTETGIIIKKL
ncbi:MAG TPA: DALR domain-containing protein [Candidatus Nanoarchaeia archaeon]|nr:DALR domain-containing protein [Candidatus Nanoarchaeia archaeon]